MPLDSFPRLSNFPIFTPITSPLDSRAPGTSLFMPPLPFPILPTHPLWPSTVPPDNPATQAFFNIINHLQPRLPPIAFPTPPEMTPRSSFFKCSICLAAFPHLWLLEQHTMLQHNGQPRRGTTTPSSVDSDRSQRSPGSSVGGTGSEEAKPFQCDQCGQSYRYRSAYIKHKEQNHRPRLPADKLFTCDICGMQFRYLKSFKKHRLNHSLEIMPLGHLPIRRQQPPDLNKPHQSSSRSSTPKSCSSGEEPPQLLPGRVVSDGKVTSSNEVEAQPSASAVGGGGQAASVGAAATNNDEPIDSLTAPTTPVSATNNRNSNSLLGMQLYPTPTPPSRERQLFSCSYCQKTVRSKENLKLHVRKHTGERPFACLFCGRAFGGKSDLTRHVRIHTGERPYHCEMCGKCFARADYLSKHLTTHLHNNHGGSRTSATSE